MINPNTFRMGLLPRQPIVSVDIKRVRKNGFKHCLKPKKKRLEITTYNSIHATDINTTNHRNTIPVIKGNHSSIPVNFTKSLSAIKPLKPTPQRKQTIHRINTLSFTNAYIKSSFLFVARFFQARVGLIV